MYPHMTPSEHFGGPMHRHLAEIRHQGKLAEIRSKTLGPDYTSLTRPKSSAFSPDPVPLTLPKAKLTPSAGREDRKTGSSGSSFAGVVIKAVVCGFVIMMIAALFGG